MLVNSTGITATSLTSSADRNPAEAERVLAMVKDAFQREQYTVRVVYRMAPLDLERARRLGGIDQR